MSVFPTASHWTRKKIQLSFNFSRRETRVKYKITHQFTFHSIPRTEFLEQHQELITYSCFKIELNLI